MFEQTFKNIDDVLWKEAGCATELDYAEQTSWMLFLKYLDDVEKANEQKAALAGKTYDYKLDKKHRWSAWAAPKKKDGSFDHDRALTGDDLIKYVDEKLFPYLKGFRTRADSANTIEYKIGEIFSEIENKFRSGYSLRDALELVDALSFNTQAQKHELSELYEAKLRNMGNAGRNGGEYYTPRPLIRAMIHVVKPKIGERIYDGACGSAGFLCESFEYLTRDRDKLSTKDMKTLQEKTFYGKEKKSLAYILGIMNMILHGIEAPNIVHTNTLTENISDIQDKDRYEIVLANPPFGGKERPEVQQNFPIKTGETAYLFLQHFIKSLKAGGRGAIVIKNTFLSNTDNASIALRKELLENCNLHTILGSLSIPVPKFAEQRRIVAILDEAFAGLATAIANTEKNLKNASELFDSYLNSILAQHNEWKIVSLGSTSERVTVGHVGITSPHYRPAGVLFLRTQNVSKTGLRLDDVKYVTREFHESSLKSRIQPGDILISRVITDRINCALIPPGFEEANCANVILVRPSKQLSSQYLLYYIRSKVAQSELLGRRKGSAQQVVNTQVLKEWSIKLPILSEQMKAVAALDEVAEHVRRLEQGYQGKLAFFSELKQSILQKAFSDELTPPPSSVIKEAAE